METGVLTSRSKITLETGVLTLRLKFMVYTGILKLRYRDNGGDRRTGDRSNHIEIQRKRLSLKFSYLDTEIRVETKVLTSRYRNKDTDRSTHIKIKR